VANKGTNLFIQMAMDVHGDRYDYTETVYKNRRTRVIIICRSHGRFKQFPQGHIRGNNCPRCVKTSISKIEMEWLDSININQQYRTQTIKFNNKWIIVDAYVPEINTVYEFYGDFWHGNPKKYSPEDINPINKKLYGDLYKITMDREELLKSAGYNLITIWESDYKNTK
jgi:G:T-mismatch repair DNA endonuclease (very short patch repair protein)